MAQEALFDALRRFSPSSQQLVHRAEQLARRRGHGFLGVEHLLAVLLETSSLQQRLQSQILQIFQRVLEPLLQARYTLRREGDAIFVTDRVHAVFTNHALAVARQRRHPRVEPEDLLIALLREGRSLPVLQLQEQGVDIQQLLGPLERVTQPRPEIPLELRGWCEDLTALAEQERLPAMIEGEREQRILEQLVRVLLSADLGLGAASPVLIGEAGVGKTVLIELLARKIAQGELPQLQGVRLIQVNMNGMLAGTIFRGMFEHRLERTIEFAKRHRDRVILFIDELHTIIGAGQTLGHPIGADQVLLAPLGRGEIRLIGATTVLQYQRYIEQDEALARRFRAILVEEPSLEETHEILQGLQPMLEEDSGLRIAPEAVEKALELSRYYLRSRRLPGKPVQWLKEAIGLAAYQRREEVAAEDVMAVISEQTGIPIDVLFRNSWGRLGRMEQVLRARVKGQDHVISQVARRLRLNLSPLREDLNRPIGVFLFLGPSGVGKTELAKALAEFLFGDEGRMVRLDMSEYASEAMLKELIGPPLGIVGCERGGKLTNAVRARPYTLVLLDEFEKAHPVIRNLFLQVFDEGWLTDGLGRKVSFSDTILVVTSNLASDKYRRLQRRLGFLPLGEEGLDFEKVRAEIERSLVEEGLLSPELKNRFDLVCVFDPLSPETLREIAQKLLRDVDERLKRLGKRLLYDNAVVEYLAQEGYDPLLGARELKRRVSQYVLEEIAPLLDQGEVFRLKLEHEGSQPKLVIHVEREVEQLEALEG